MSSENGDDPYAPFAQGHPTQVSQPTQVSRPGPESSWEGPPPRGRGRVIAIIAGLGVLGLLGGVGAGLVAAGGDTELVASPAETATAEPTGAPILPATTTAAATPTPGAVSPSLIKDDFSPLPDHPETVGADFGYILMVTGGPKKITLIFDRAQFLTGAAAKKANGGQEPPDDYVIKNTNTYERTVTVDPRASLVGTARLNNENGVVKRELLSPEVFLANLKDALADDGRVAVWLRHKDGDLDGDVTAISEQYLP